MHDVDRFEGDVNQAEWRGAWRASRGPASRSVLEADDGVFLHQALSTPLTVSRAHLRRAAEILCMNPNEDPV
jgi:hypothetical protein